MYTRSHPAPSPKDGYVLIRVKAFGLNRSELFTRQGFSPGIEFPRVLGIECVGEVNDAGGSDLWKVGDAVAAIMGGMGRQYDGRLLIFRLIDPRAYYFLTLRCRWIRGIHSHSPDIRFAASQFTRQYRMARIRCSSGNIYDRLDSAFARQAFSDFRVRVTIAWGTLSKSLDLSPNDTLLIRGGSTSVGLAAATLAKALFSCRKVIATTRSKDKIGGLKAAGIDDVILDTDGKISEQVLRVTGGKGADKCIELVGPTVLADSCASMGPEGVVSIVGCVGGEWTVKDFDYMACLAPHKVGERRISSHSLHSTIGIIAVGSFRLHVSGYPESATAKNCGCSCEWSNEAWS